MNGPSSHNPLPRVVIVGGGFAGLQVAKRLKRAPVEVTLVDRHNYHLFQPLLYQVATGGLSPANIATSLRAILGRNRNCEVLMAEVTAVDADKRQLLMGDDCLTYDFLVVAAGADNTWFGNEQWKPFARGLKSLSEAVDIRRRVFLAFEAAERQSDPQRRQQLMTFVIVGGGPTGVELAGALAEITRHTLKHDFRKIDPQETRIILVETSPHVLNGYPVKLCEYAESKLEKLGVDVRVGHRVTDVTADHVQLTPAADNDGDQPTESIPARTVLWAAGIQGNPLGQQIAETCGVQTERSGRVPVTPHLHVTGYPELFVIGDLAHCLDKQDEPLPCLAPVAIQQGRYVAKRIRRQIRQRDGNSKSKDKPFRYRDLGSMATIGRAAAIAEVGKLQLRGFVAWLMWLVVHLMQLVQFQNRVLVLIQWGWNYITFNRSARLITGDVDPADIDTARHQSGSS